MMTARQIIRGLSGRWAGGYGTARCPAHDDRSPSLSVRDGDDGRVLVHCHAGCDGRDVIDALRRIGLWSDSGPEQVRPPTDRDRGADPPASPDARAADYIVRILRERRPLRGSPAERYLTEARRVPLPPCPDVCGFHPAVRSPSGETVPAMVSVVTDARDAGRVLALHFTALRPDGTGKAAVTPTKWLRGPAKGGAIRLCPDDAVTQGLGLCEGIETGLAIVGAGWAPVWAAGSAPFLAAVPPLPPLSLTAFADGDPAGAKAAEAVAATWRRAGLPAAIVPAPAGRDWEDARHAS